MALVIGIAMILLANSLMMVRARFLTASPMLSKSRMMDFAASPKAAAMLSAVCSIQSFNLIGRCFGRVLE